MKRQATEEVAESSQKRTKLTIGPGTNNTEDAKTSSQDSNSPSSQISRIHASSETAETDLQPEPTNQRTMPAQEALDLLNAAIEGRKTALVEQQRLATLAASGPNPSQDGRSVASDASHDPSVPQWEIAMAKRTLALIAEQQQVRVKHLSDILHSDDRLKWETPLRLLRFDWFSARRAPRSRRSLRGYLPRWPSSDKRYHSARDAAITALREARNEACEAQADIDEQKNAEAELRERLLQHSHQYLFPVTTVREEASNDRPNPNEPEPTSPERKPIVPTDELRVEQGDCLRAAAKEVADSRDRFDYTRNRYGRQVGQHLANLENANVRGTRTEFDQTYYMDRGLANRRAAQAEAAYIRTKASTQVVGALRSELVTSNFRDRDSDGYADDEDAAHWYFQEVDKERIEKWLDALPGDEGSGFTPVHTPVIGFAEARRGSYDGIVGKEVDVVSRTSHERYPVGSHKAKIDSYQNMQE